MTPRRSPDPAQRQRDPAQAREKLLDAATEEFGAKGFAGARVRDIAARAGLNQQLISYYFGGKAGLYEALQQRWRQRSADLGRAELPLDEAVINFLRASLANPAWTRLLAWEGLADHSGQQHPQDNADLMRWIVAENRRRQDRGELAPDLDPAYVSLVLFAAAAAPLILPHVTRNLTGLDPTSEDFQQYYAEQLAKVIRRLRG